MQVSLTNLVLRPYSPWPIFCTKNLAHVLVDDQTYILNLTIILKKKKKKEKILLKKSTHVEGETINNFFRPLSPINTSPYASIVEISVRDGFCF